MRVLTVCSGNTDKNRPLDFARDRPFVAEQVRGMEALGVEVDVFLVEGNGVGGYLKNLDPLKARLAAKPYDLIHAHFGLCGLLSVLQRQVPVVVTFHGCDINLRRNSVLSSAASLGAAWRVFVSDKMPGKLLVPPRRAFTVLPCGVDLDTFTPIPKAEARAALGLEPDRPYVLFASSFAAPAKNYPLARAAVERLQQDMPDAELLELWGYARTEVAQLMSACDAMLMTSSREGSPQVVKEAMACGCPIVSTDVGDVRAVLNGVEGCRIVASEPEAVAAGLADVLAWGQRTDGRVHIAPLGNARIAERLLGIYERVAGERASERVFFAGKAYA